MKNVLKSIRYKLPMLQLMLLTGTYAFAQDSTGSSESSSTVTQTSTASTVAPLWYMNPWVWAVGGVLLILILIAVFRGNSNNRSEVTRTSRTTTEIKND